MTHEELDTIISDRAETIAKTVPGLEWKIWFLNDKEHELGGLYQFYDETSLDNYVNGPLFDALKNNPAISCISVKKFTSLESATAITRGPV